MTAINMGIFNEIANNKADRDLRNVDLTKTDVVIEYQEPTAENNYIWYRLYASGWVEQGGIIPNLGSDVDQIITFPIILLLKYDRKAPMNLGSLMFSLNWNSLNHKIAHNIFLLKCFLKFSFTLPQ